LLRYVLHAGQDAQDLDTVIVSKRAPICCQSLHYFAAWLLQGHFVVVCSTWSVTRDGSLPDIRRSAGRPMSDRGSLMLRLQDDSQQISGASPEQSAPDSVRASGSDGSAAPDARESAWWGHGATTPMSQQVYTLSSATTMPPQPLRGKCVS
jgi:hypothetical protein